MPYIQKDQAGHVVCISDVQQFAGQEFDANAVLYISPEQQAAQKLALLAIAQVNRETLISRLTWLSQECAASLKAAEAIPDATAIALQTANLAAIATATNALVNALEDPRVVNAVNGAAKQAIQIVYGEIVLAFKNSAPALYARMKKLDTLT